MPLPVPAAGPGSGGHAPAAGPYVTRLSPGRAGLWKERAPLLLHLDMELTERCNNDCVHCCINRPADDGGARRRELDADAVLRILGEAAGLGCLTVRFTGGEPLLREDFEDIYTRARKLGLQVILFTNATRITPRVADLLARMPPRRQVEVSVYGMTAAGYEAVSRVPGSHAAAWAGIRRLEERGVPFVVKGMWLPPTRDELDAFETWARARPGAGQRPTLTLLYDLRTRRDSEARNRLIRGLRPAPEEVVRLLSRDRTAYRADMCRFCARFLGPRGDRLFACGAGCEGCVDAYGGYQMCLALRHPETVYDLTAGTLRDALTRFFPAVRERRAANPDYRRRCARCFLKGLCEQCPARAWTEHGTLDTPVDYLCDVAHAQARDLGLLDPGERSWDIADGPARVRRLEAEVGG